MYNVNSYPPAPGRRLRGALERGAPRGPAGVDRALLVLLLLLLSLIIILLLLLLLLFILRCLLAWAAGPGNTMWYIL